VSNPSDNGRSFLRGLLFAPNLALMVLVVIHFCQGLYIAAREFRAGNLSLGYTVIFLMFVVGLCGWRIYKSIKIHREIVTTP
jgi:uncharacterized membrane protein YqjE